MVEQIPTVAAHVFGGAEDDIVEDIGVEKEVGSGDQVEEEDEVAVVYGQGRTLDHNTTA